MFDYLVKNVTHDSEPRKDNSDKKVLFEKDLKLRSAEAYREDLSFIKNEALKENLSYQMQYLEFQIRFYNEYQMYLTLESLHCKSITTTIGTIVEGILYDLKTQDGRAQNEFESRFSFLELIDDAYQHYLIERDMQDRFHTLRKERNLLHISEIKYQEYDAYNIDGANTYIRTLIDFIEAQKSGSNNPA